MAVIFAAALSLVIAGCSSTGGGSEPSGSSAPLTYRTASGTCAVQPNAGIDEAAATSYLKPFLAGPKGLLVTDKLPKPVNPDTTVTYLNNGTVIGGLMEGYMKEATKAAGVHFQNVDTGTDANSINSALDSVVASKPNIVVSAALDATFFQKQLKQLQDNGTVIVYIGAVNADKFGLQDSVGGKGASEVNGKALAASAVYFTCGTGTNFAFYNIPEFAFSQVQLDAAKAELKQLCPKCTLRTVDISITDPSPADKIVSDLQAHPDTQFFITPGDQFQIGLGQKAKLAGVTNAKGIGQSSVAPNIQQIAGGQQTAGFAVDYDMYIWMALDEGFRRLQGQDVKYDDWSKVVLSMSRVLTEKTAKDYSTPAGYIADPNMAAEFVKLWK
ncbi:sugar ABC transporter substrate-binding protein [Rathayibacter soli]|uniref:sugar ABC transporter substrate-binding protein n=1 Tax=Rathayibacter soli TaxID=3144168 RepID=UPI0027E4A0C3|nr:substrate-binding domain-containing protein [Glaciibacter superstes]